MKNRTSIFLLSLIALCVVLYAFFKGDEHSSIDYNHTAVSELTVPERPITEEIKATTSREIETATHSPIHTAGPVPSHLDSQIIRSKELSHGITEYILHSGSTQSPTRIAHQYQWDSASNSWSLISETKMAANSFLVRQSPETIEKLASLSDAFQFTSIGSSKWLRVDFPFDWTEDRLGAWTEAVLNLGVEAEKNYQFQASELFSNDPYFQEGKQPYLDGIGQIQRGSINASTLWEVQTDTTSAPIAILDSGLNHTHLEFVGQLWTNSGEIDGNGVDDDQNGYIDDQFGYDFVDSDNLPEDLNGHGTHLAGLVGAKGNNSIGITGIAWNAKIMPLRVLNSNGYGYVSDIVEGIHYAINNGASVMLMAWQSSRDSTIYREALQSAQDADLVWSVPAGNGGQSLDEFPAYPAVYNFQNQITVGSHDLDLQYSAFSNYSINHVDISAPGNDLISTSSSNHQYVRKTGTSQASALVAGILTHLKVAFPEEPGWRTIQRLKSSSSQRPYPNYYRTSHRKDYVSTGMIDCSAPELFVLDSTPGNDDLENAWQNESPEFVIHQILSDATAELGEPSHGGIPAECSVWHQWTPRRSGTTTIQVDHPDASIAVYQLGGTIDLLREVSSASPAPTGASLIFEASANTNYYCTVNVPAATSDVIRLELLQTPDNLDFSSAATIYDEHFFSTSRANTFLTSSSTEAWFRWTAPTNGLLKFTTASDLHAQFTAYQLTAEGELGNALTSVSLTEDSTYGTASINVLEAVEYAFKWTNLHGGNGHVSVSGTYQYPPEDVYAHTWNGRTAPQWGTESYITASVTGGTYPLTYKWYHNGKYISKHGSLYFPSLTTSDAGNYYVVVSNSQGSVTSNILELEVQTLPPVVRLSPSVIIEAEGGSASVYADISNSLGASVTIEWFLNDIKIQDSTQRTLELTDLNISDSGVLIAKATNQFGSSESQEVLLNITENPLENWSRILPDTAGIDLDYALFTGDRFFTISGNKVYSSANGADWHLAIFEEPLDTISGIAYGNGLYVAVGQKGSNGTIATSTDGMFWEISHAQRGSYPFTSITFGNGIFVTKRSTPNPNTTFYTSTDADNWSSAQLSASNLGKIHFGNGIFLISRTGIHYTSTDGLNWQANAIASGGPTRTGSLTFHDGYFYKISGSSFSAMGIYRSTDGITWEVISGPAYIGALYDNKGLYYDGEYFMVPDTIDFKISTTGTGFLRHTGNLTGDLQQGWLTDVAIGNGTLIGIDTNGRIMLGERITDLTFDESLFQYDLHRLEALDDLIIALGTTSSGSSINARGITWSRDGLSWEINETPRLQDITLWNNLYYAVGAPNINTGATGLMYSADLINWTRIDSIPDQAHLIASGNGRMVLVLDDGQVSMSTNATDWSSPTATDGATDTAHILRFLNGEFWLVRDSALYHSTDGQTWSTSQLSGVRDITFTNGKYFAAFGPSTSIYESTNGQDWTDIIPQGGMNPYRIKSNGSQVLGASYGSIVYSADTDNWTNIEAELQTRDIAFFNDVIFYIGDDGRMYRHGEPIAAPTLQADLEQTFALEAIHVGEVISIPYTASTNTGDDITTTLYVDGNAVDSTNDGTALEWVPATPGMHNIWLEAIDGSGRVRRTDSIDMNVRQGSTTIVSSPVESTFTGLHRHEDQSWISTESGQLYLRTGNTSTWQMLDLPTIDQIAGISSGLNGRIYVYGTLYNSLGDARGLVLRSRDGIIWEQLGTLLNHSVIEVLETEESVFAITQDLTLTDSSAPTQLFLKQDNTDWSDATSNDMIRSLVVWENRIYSKDRSGDILVSDDGFEWTLEYAPQSGFDSREHTLVPADNALLFVGQSRIFHNRINGSEWGYNSAYSRAVESDGVAYIQLNDSSIYSLTTEGSLISSNRFSNLLNSVVKTGSYEQNVLWLTSTGQIVESISDTPDTPLDHAQFPDQNIQLIEGIPFHIHASGDISSMDPDSDWSSTTFGEEATAQQMMSFATGGGTALFIGSDGIYRHDSNDDSWTLIPDTSDAVSMTYSDGRFWVVGVNFAVYSNDTGATWVSFFPAIQAVAGATFTATEVIVDANRIAINGVNRDVLYSQDLGINWLDTGRPADRIAFSDNELVLVGGTYNDQFITTSDGINYSEKEEIPFDLPSKYFTNHSWGVRDYAYNNGLEYIAVSNYQHLLILSRESGNPWQIILPPTALSTFFADFYISGNSVFLTSENITREIILHNITTTLSEVSYVNLGVGDSATIEVQITNHGFGSAPASNNIKILAMLQPERTSTLDEATPIGEGIIDIPSLAEGETIVVTQSWRIPDSVSPGTYHFRIAVSGLRDAYNSDNTATTNTTSVHITPREIEIEAVGSGLGTITNLDPREIYPDKFALPLLITPATGYVYSAGTGSTGISAASITTVVLDGSFNGKIYFEPSYETWALEQITSPSQRARGQHTDGSPMPNVFKYLLGIDAYENSYSSPISLIETDFGATKTAEIRVVHGRENEAFELQISDDLNKWNPLTPSVNDEGEWLKYEAIVPETHQDQAFFKLETPE